MKIIDVNNLDDSRVVRCKNDGFTSNRILVESDNMGYTLTKTVVHPGIKQFWHYKDHLESCYCIQGEGILTNAKTTEEFRIKPDMTYVLDNNDPHYFEALETVVLICVFNPPLVGNELHNDDGSYKTAKKSDSPVYDVKSIHMDRVIANDYNPNAVAPPEMALLETSIWEDGYTQPIVTVYDEENDIYVVVDGFHRHKTMTNSERIRKREKEMLPIVVLKKDMQNRMASTIRHNRARGTHNVELMSTIVSELVEMGKGDAWICKHIGMSPDELLRLKQITGLASLFENQDFSDSWDAEDFEEAINEAA